MDIKQCVAPSNSAIPTEQQINTKFGVTYSLLDSLKDFDDFCKNLQTRSLSSSECIAMRQTGHISLLVSLLYDEKLCSSKVDQRQVASTLRNIVNAGENTLQTNQEKQVLEMLERIRAYCDQQQQNPAGSSVSVGPSDVYHRLCEAMLWIRDKSAKRGYVSAIFLLGGIQALSEFLYVEGARTSSSATLSLSLRLHCCVALNNLIDRREEGRSLLCSLRPALLTLTDQLHSPNIPLVKAVISLFKSLSWKLDIHSIQALQDVKLVKILLGLAMQPQPGDWESLLTEILSVVLNLLVLHHEIKVDVCEIDGALDSLVQLLQHESAAGTALCEMGGKILMKLSKIISENEAYRQVLRERGCLATLVGHLGSNSVTVVRNACLILWNLSAGSAEDKQALLELGALRMLEDLVGSDNKEIREGSNATLKKLLKFKSKHHTVLPASSSQRHAGILGDCGNVFPKIATEMHWRANTSLAGANTSLAGAKPSLVGAKPSLAGAKPSLAAGLSNKENWWPEEDRPINYSLMYSEKMEDSSLQEQPIDYSLKKRKERILLAEAQQPWASRALPDAGAAAGLQHPLPDQIVHFATEDTPVSLSPVSSLSVLSGLATPDYRQADGFAGKLRNLTWDPSIVSPMFSRCSSFGSLGSFEMSSLYSEIFSAYSSQQMSGMASPSDVPESASACGSNPPSPRVNHSVRANSVLRFNDRVDVMHLLQAKFPGQDRLCLQADELEDFVPDELRHFAVENSPMTYSNATSLSSLVLPTSSENGLLKMRIKNPKLDLEQLNGQEDELRTFALEDFPEYVSGLTSLPASTADSAEWQETTDLSRAKGLKPRVPSEKLSATEQLMLDKIAFDKMPKKNDDLNVCAVTPTQIAFNSSTSEVLPVGDRKCAFPKRAPYDIEYFSGEAEERPTIYAEEGSPNLSTRTLSWKNCARHLRTGEEGLDEFRLMEEFEEFGLTKDNNQQSCYFETYIDVGKSMLGTNIRDNVSFTNKEESPDVGFEDEHNSLSSTESVESLTLSEKTSLAHFIDLALPKRSGQFSFSNDDIHVHLQPPLQTPMVSPENSPPLLQQSPLTTNQKMTEIAEINAQWTLKRMERMSVQEKEDEEKVVKQPSEQVQTQAVIEHAGNVSTSNTKCWEGADGTAKLLISDSQTVHCECEPEQCESPSKYSESQAEHCGALLDYDESPSEDSECESNEYSQSNGCAASGSNAETYNHSANVKAASVVQWSPYSAKVPALSETSCTVAVEHNKCQPPSSCDRGSVLSVGNMSFKSRIVDLLRKKNMKSAGGDGSRNNNSKKLKKSFSFRFPKFRK